jgi:hypothetical protein
LDTHAIENWITFLPETDMAGHLVLQRCSTVLCNDGRHTQIFGKKVILHGPVAWLLAERNDRGLKVCKVKYGMSGIQNAHAMCALQY